VAALFAIMTKVGAYSILRVYTLIFGVEAGPLGGLIDPWLLPIALATMVIGTLGVLSATELRRQVAYLVVVSVGLLMTAFGLGTQASIAAGLYYLAHTTFAAAALFLLADVIAMGRGTLQDRLDPGPAIANASLVGSLFFITAILVSGLPPLSGFLGKYMVLRAAVDAPSMPWVLGVILTSGLFAVIALARSGSLLFYKAEGTWWLVFFLLKVLWDILVANVAVAALILGGRRCMRPAFVSVPLDLRTELAISILANTVSLTPGTVSAWLSPDRRTLVVHGLRVTDPAALVLEIKTRYERPLIDIFESTC
jgi:formate hydrogenlyase subunit 3/multisubunit Na+/H+ antiporter MnhD subunit